MVPVFPVTKIVLSTVMKREQHRPDQELRRPVEMPAVRRAPEEEQTDQKEKVCRAVKDAVPSPY
jgi:hypothetical protein